jgi:hypothetical protein
MESNFFKLKINQITSSPFSLESIAIAIGKKCFFEVKAILKLLASTLGSPSAFTS